MKECSSSDLTKEDKLNLIYDQINHINNEIKLLNNDKEWISSQSKLYLYKLQKKALLSEQEKLNE